MSTQGTEAAWRRLAAAVLLRAALDALDDDDPALAAPARRWLSGDGAQCAEELDISEERVAAWLADLVTLPWSQLTLFE